MASLVKHMSANAETYETLWQLTDLLEHTVGLVGKNFRCIVKGYDKHGMVVDVVVETALKTYLLSGTHILWFDFPWEIASWPLAKRIELSATRIPIRSEFKVKVIHISERIMRLHPSKYAQPILKNLSLPLTPAKCPYRYLIVVDLEATCDYAPIPQVDINTAEIIEFPWVTIDTQHLEIVDIQQHYVKPFNMAGLTQYTTKLTGINHDTLRNQDMLQSVIAKVPFF
eukprot:TRINITY_DN3164_c0_g1_i12.p1 TRINITY_DN3164_c0_g1~~TRINITY_DN3164_c0_g1_i12.p1  ORF type:complete len:227 (-),score=40.73 TRINITY_DN3164_c0_g1_i12:1038-1718(-)